MGEAEKNPEKDWSAAENEFRNCKLEISRLRALCDEAGVDWLPGAINPNQTALFSD